MDSSQFEFLDYSEIGEDDYQHLVGILEEKKICIPSSDVSVIEDLKEVGEDFEESGIKIVPDEKDFIIPSKKDSSTSGISFFVDGGTAEDIEPGTTPPLPSSSSLATPPPSVQLHQDDPSPEAPPPPIEEEPLVSAFPDPPAPQPAFLSQPPPSMVPPMNFHPVSNAGPLYNGPPPYTPHSAHNGMYPLPQNHHGHPPPYAHTVHIENCHVNLSPYGTHQPPPPPSPLYGPSQHYQGPPSHQVYQSYMLPDPVPPMQSMPLKPGMDKEFEHKRHETHGRGGYRGRGGRGGRGRRRRDDHERSNSVSSDHSSYSDSGAKPHYKEGGHPTPPFPNHYPVIQYPSYIPYHHPVPRPHQGFPLMPNQYLSDIYPQQYLAYPPPPPPVSVSLMPHETAHAHHHSECESLPPVVPNHLQEQRVTSITTHTNYIVTTSNVSPLADASACQYSYSSLDDATLETSSSSTTTLSHAVTNGEAVVITPQSPSPIEEVLALKEEKKEEQDITQTSTPVEFEQVEVKEEQEVVAVVEKVAVTNGNVVQVEEESSAVKPLVEGESSLEDVTVVSKDAQLPVEENCNVNSVECAVSSSDNAVKQTLSNVEKVSQLPSNLESQPNKVKNPSPKPLQQNNQKAAKAPQVKETERSSGPAVVSDSNKVSLVPSSSQRNSDKDMNGTVVVSMSQAVTTVTSTVTKSNKNRKKSPHNKENSAITQSLTSSITVYNKSITISESKETKNSLPQEGKAQKTNIVTEAQPSLPMVDKAPSHLEKKNTQENIPVSQLKSNLAPSNSTAPSVEPAAWGQKKRWSQLFKPNEDFSNKQIAFVSPFNAKESSDPNLESGAVKENGDASFSCSDVDKAKVGALLKKYNQDYRPVLLQPRGLINKNYWCYVNAPLQALLACPSLYQLARTLAKEAGYRSGNASTPFINSIVDFASDFSSMPPAVKQGRKEKGAGAAKKDPEVVPGAPFEPTCVYKMLMNCKENQFAEGRQQDAEEMLSCVLNGLHDEMVESVKLSGGYDGAANGEEDVGDTGHQDASSDEAEWKVQGPKRKSYVTRTAHFQRSPISHIFWGQLRSVLQQAGGNTTANLQPFNTLPLDIQSPKVDSLKDALSQLVTREEITGLTCSRTNQEVTASNQVTIEDLPRVLILQLKRFIYDKDGGLQKVTKRLQFPIDLEMTKDLLSPNRRGKFSAAQRKYKLFAIVNHEGKEATKGHYVADVFHNGYNCWIRYDDSNVKALSEGAVLRHEPPRVPYLLFYRRSDTLSPPPNHPGAANGNAAGKANK